MKPQFCCECGETRFEVYEINYGVEMECTRCCKPIYYTLLGYGKK